MKKNSFFLYFSVLLQVSVFYRSFTDLILQILSLESLRSLLSAALREQARASEQG